MNIYIQKTIELAKKNVEQGGRPFACLIVRDGEVLAEGTNQVAQTKDPTAHAGLVAIREASAKLNTEDLSNCEFYLMSEPCPMCLAAMYYCSPLKVVFITFKEEYKEFYRSDLKYFAFEEFYKEFGRSWQERSLAMIYHSAPEAIEVFKLWKKNNN